MKKILSLLFLGLAFRQPVQADGVKCRDENGPLEQVNILQGTDSSFDLSHGNTLPLVGAPWGMTDWSIENHGGKWFFSPNGKIDGFRATRQPSPWIGDYGQFVLMPQAGALRMEAGDRMSEYDARTAILRPDYERLELANGRITSELTATERCAVFRLAFHQGQSGRLVLQAYGKSEIAIEGRSIRGLSRANRGGVAGNFASYFVVQLDRDPSRAAPSSETPPRAHPP